MRRQPAQIRTHMRGAKTGAACYGRLQTFWMRRQADTFACQRRTLVNVYAGRFESVTRLVAGTGVAGTGCSTTFFATAATTTTSTAASHAHVLLHLRIFGALFGRENFVDRGVRFCTRQGALRGQVADLVAACSIAAVSFACTAVFRVSCAVFMLAREVVAFASAPELRIAVTCVCWAEVSDNRSVRNATRRCTLLPPPGPSGPCANIAGAERIVASKSAMAAFFMLRKPPGPNSAR